MTPTITNATTRLQVCRDTAFADTDVSELMCTPSLPLNGTNSPPGESSKLPDAPAPGTKGISATGDKHDGKFGAGALAAASDVASHADSALSSRVVTIRHPRTAEASAERTPACFSSPRIDRETQCPQCAYIARFID